MNTTHTQFRIKNRAIRIVILRTPNGKYIGDLSIEEPNLKLEGFIKGESYNGVRTIERETIEEVKMALVKFMSDSDKPINLSEFEEWPLSI